MSESSEPTSTDTNAASTLSDDDGGILVLGMQEDGRFGVIGGTEIISADDSDGDGIDQEDLMQGFKDMKDGKVPSQAFLDYTSLTSEQVASFKEVSNNGSAVPPVLQSVVDFAAATDAKVSGGGMFEADMTAELTAASTPDPDNKNHEWRDGVKYVRGTTIVVQDAKPVSENPNRIASPWDKKGMS